MRLPDPPPPLCAAPGCTRAARTRALCPTHYQWARRHPDRPLEPIRAPHGGIPGRVLLVIRVSPEAKRELQREAQSRRYRGLAPYLAELLEEHARGLCGR